MFHVVKKSETSLSNCIAATIDRAPSRLEFFQLTSWSLYILGVLLDRPVSMIPRYWSS